MGICSIILFGNSKNIYHGNWIDLNKNGKMDVYENPDAAIDDRINDLLSQMNLEEKTCQTATLYGFGRVLEDELPTKEWKNRVWKDGIANIDEHLNGLDRPYTKTQYSWPASTHAEAINQVQKFFIEETRLGIPVDFTNEGIRGICNEGGTSFPAQIGVGSTWDVDLVTKIGEITGKEGRVLGYTNIYSPILDLARDPRWGRTVECYGEDPFHVGELGLAQIIALQKQGVVSTPKHFAVYSVPKGGRDGDARTDPHITEREMETLYLAPFKKAFVEGNALGTMASYNDYNGIPVIANSDFLIRRLRKEWGFQGYVVSDSRAVEFVYEKHHVAENQKDAVRQVVLGGLNVRTRFSPPEDYILPLRELVKEGIISKEMLDERVVDVLRVKFWLGLFDNPYIEDPKSADKIVNNSEYEKISYEASQKSIVLLKNENKTLPLRKDIKSILVTGPNANAKKSSISRYGPSMVKVTSILEGIRSKVSDNVEVKYTKGCDVVDANWPESEIMPFEITADEQAEIDKAVKMAKTVDIAVVVLGDDENIVGESKSRTSLDLPGYQRDLVKAIYETGTPTVVVLINGRPMTINWVDRNIPAIVEAWFPGKHGGTAVADVLFGDYNPGGKLPITFPKTVGQLPLNFPQKPGSAGGSENETRIKGMLFPFGHGLSYTSFAYSNLSISTDTENADVLAIISFDVKNVGDRVGDEIPQLYINDETSSVTTYEKNLRGFERINLAPGKSQTITFELKKDDLAIYNREMDFVVEPGTFKVMVGSSSEDIRLEGEFIIE
ncbi:MAG: glycoside hydrolase family 3 C-terminal domain-containing protein [Candidatus Marinimicrobia bacterium]|nr:glycoside hydrolase family 3 C-terminal domain-containing protein [Candidatus Neomarinimicrobiota bacterium]